MFCFKRKKTASHFKRQGGFTLIETIVALALLGIISASFLSGVANSSKARAGADEKVSAKVLAETLMEDIKKDLFSSSYAPAIPPEFPGYTANITVDNLRSGTFQLVTVAINHRGGEVFNLESYKVKR